MDKINQTKIALIPNSMNVKHSRHKLLEMGVYNPTPEETISDIEGLYEALCDVLIPAFMSDKPYSVGRARIESAIKEEKYIDDPLVHRILLIANRKASPFEYLKKLHKKLEGVKASELTGARIAKSEI